MAQNRQLAAIMFTDIVGYTALMGEDEQKAFDILDKNRQLQKPLIEQYGGTWIKELGDGVLACFTTVSDAVNAAVNIQKACHAAKDFQLRIGIHLGEVIFENKDVFGDGVNIASRIQAMAPIGSILVSEAVYKNITNKKEIQTNFFREEALKHVKEPVRLYEVVVNPFQPKPEIPKRELVPLEKKSIAVLPFINMSSDPEQEFFSDGLTEDIITDLSHLEKLLVISRSSMMTFKGTNKKIKEIAADVGAQYVLEGSVRKAGNNLRITAQLIDAVNDVHLWAERYTGTLDDVFDIQEKVARSIVEALDLKLTAKEETGLSNHPIVNAKAYEYFILARHAMWKRTRQSLEDAIMFAQKGLDLVGDNAYLYAIMSTTYAYFSHFALSTDSYFDEKAHQLALKSLSLDAECAQGYLTLGETEFKKGNLQEAAKIFKQMLQLDPNNTDAMIWLMVSYNLSGRPDASLPISEKMMRIDPLSIFSYQMIGDTKFYHGDIEGSLPYFHWWLQKDPETPFVRYLCAWSFALNGEYNEAFTVLDAIIKDTPTLIFSQFAQFFKYALQGNKENALQSVTEELKQGAASLNYFPVTMAWAYALLDEKDKAVWWLNKGLDLGYSPYPLMLKWETFHRVLHDHPGFQAYMQDIKKRSEAFVI